jgi:DNA-binding LacI/PurR family transcriptional regulator
MVPPLTTIPIHPPQLAEMALEMMFAQIHGQTAQSVVLPANEILARGSVKSLGRTRAE